MSSSSLLAKSPGPSGATRATCEASRSVAGEFFAANVVVVRSGGVQHGVQRLDHRRRPGDVVNRGGSFFQVPLEHALVDEAGLTLPRLTRLPGLRHRGNQLEVGILMFETLEFGEEGCVFGPPVREEQKDAVGQLLMRGSDD